MLNAISKSFNLFKAFVYDLLHPQGMYFRLSLAFFIGMFFKTLLMDFDFFSTYIVNSNFSYWLSEILVSLAADFYKLIQIPVKANGRNLALFNNVGVLVDSTCLGYRGIILFASFILVYKGQLFSKLIYIAIGFFVLESGNLVRVIILAYIQHCCPERFDVLHFYLAKIILYPIILLLWIIWVEKFSTINMSLTKN